MTANKKRVIFLTREKNETEEEFQKRVEMVVKTQEEKGYNLVGIEEKGDGVILTFEI